VGLLAAWALVNRRVELPPVGPGVEQICAETMQRTAADLSWVAPNREERVRGREIKSVTLGELPSHAGRLVRVAGVLHAEFEWVALYPSRAAMQERSWRAPWVTLGSLWPDEAFITCDAPVIVTRPRNHSPLLGVDSPRRAVRRSFRCRAGSTPPRIKESRICSAN
jgi:hypothetical protein